MFEECQVNGPMLYISCFGYSQIADASQPVTYQPAIKSWTNASQPNGK